MKKLGFIQLLLLNVILVVSKAIEEKNLPIFNLKGGFYNYDSISLIISYYDTAATIYYTLDGSIPTENSYVYNQPITLKNKSEEENVLSNIVKVDPNRNYTPYIKIKKANVVRAIAKLADGTFTDVVSHTYFVGIDRDKLYGNVPVISIMTDPDNLFDYEKGIYCMGKKYDDWIKEDPSHAQKPPYEMKGNFNIKGKEGERPANIEFFPSEQSRKGFNEAAGIRIAGDVSRTYLQKSFRIVFREKYGKKSLDYDLIPGNMRSDGTGPVTKYKTFVIRNGGNDQEVSKMRDKIVQDSVINKDLVTQHTLPVVVFLDGEYWGVYILTDDYTKQYMENKFDIDPDNLIIVKSQKSEDGGENGQKIEEGTESDLTEFKHDFDLILNGDMSDSLQYTQVSKLIDLEDFAYYCALNIFIENTDGIFQNKNWAFWRIRQPQYTHQKEDGKWRTLMFDTDFSIGIYRRLEEYDSVLLNQVLNSDFKDYFGSRLIQSLLRNDQFKSIFINALCDISNIDFEPEPFTARFNDFYSKIHPLMNDNYLRFYTTQATSQFEKFHEESATFIKNWILKRQRIFIKTIGKQIGLEPPVNINVSVRIRSGGDGISDGCFTINQGTKRFNDTYSGDYFKESVISLEAIPHKGKKLEYWTINNCEFADPKYATISHHQSDQNTIAVYPNENCNIEIFFK